MNDPNSGSGGANSGSGNQPQADRDRIIRQAVEKREFVVDVDGFYYWWPNHESCGHLSAFQLRALADELDRRNERWQALIERDLASPAAPLLKSSTTCAKISGTTTGEQPSKRDEDQTEAASEEGEGFDSSSQTAAADSAAGEVL